uniref:Aldehyde dehydrogenase domain-containing protein n=1 Tax=Timema genevievae TaxID=629358 RepID=A0A7R9K5Q4_TIMGE|nr:unnamed protein product [Timema genevievae]
MVGGRVKAVAWHYNRPKYPSTPTRTDGSPENVDGASYQTGRGSGSFFGGLLIGTVGTRESFRIMGMLAIVGGITYGLLHYFWLRKVEAGNNSKEEQQEYSEGEHLNSEASESFINIKHKDSVISSEHQNLFNEVNNCCSKAFLEHKKIIPRSRSSSLEMHSHLDHQCRVDLLKSALHKDHIFSNNEKARKQCLGEPFENFYAELIALSTHREFGDQEDKLVRAQIILGVNSQSIKQHLLREDTTLNKVVDYCKSVELADKNLKTIEDGRRSSQSDIFKVSRKTTTSQPSKVQNRCHPQKTGQSRSWNNLQQTEPLRPDPKENLDGEEFADDMGDLEGLKVAPPSSPNNKPEDKIASNSQSPNSETNTLPLGTNLPNIVTRGDPPPVCDLCDAPLNVYHILMECRKSIYVQTCSVDHLVVITVRLMKYILVLCSVAGRLTREREVVGRTIRMTLHPVRTLTQLNLIQDKAFVDGVWKSSASGKTFNVINPSSGTILGAVPDMDESDTKAAIEAAHKAFLTWSKTTGKERSSILRNWFNLLVKNENEIARIVSSESGKAFKEAIGEVAYGNSFIEWFSEEARRIHVSLYIHF